MSKKGKASWDTAIQDAEQMIKQLRARIRELKIAIKVFKERRDAGESFPNQKGKEQKPDQT